MICKKTRVRVDGKIETRVLIWCPGCDELHALRVEGEVHPVWEWNGSLDKPTFRPSLIALGVKRCHSFITDGEIRFLGDCEHELKNQTVPLPELPDWV